MFDRSRIVFSHIHRSEIGRCLLAVSVLLLLMSSCATTSGRKAHLDVSQLPATIDSASSDNYWAVLHWVTTNKQRVMPYNRRVVDERKQVAGLMVFDKWAKNITAEYPFLSMIKGDIVLTGSVEDNRIAKEALNSLKAPIYVRPDATRVTSMPWAQFLVEAGFTAWLSENRPLVLTEGEYGDRSRAIANLQRLLYSKVIDESLREVKRLKQAQQYDSALALLKKELGNYPGDPELMAQLGDIASLKIRGELDALRNKSLQPVTAALAKNAKLTAVEKLVAAAEASLAGKKSMWADDKHMSVGLPKAESYINDLEREVAGARAELWGRRLRGLASQKQYWDGYLLTQKLLKEADGYSPVMAVTLQEGLWNDYLAFLPTAYTDFLSLAQQEMENAERYGVTLVLCSMLDSMTAFVTSNNRPLPGSIAGLQGRAGDFRTRARDFFGTWVNRKLVIQSFSSGDPGLGTTFVRDLENILSTKLTEGTINYGVTLAEGGYKPLPRDYVIAKGNVAAFAVDKGDPRSRVKLIRRRGRVTEELNPEYEARMKKRRSVYGIPPKVWRQKIYEYTKHVEEVDVIAHARLTYNLRHQSDDTFNEINRFLKRSFLQETIDPRETKVTMETVAEAEQPMDQEPSPVNETVWVASQMKDWARNETEKILAMQVLRYIADYPNQLAAKAAEFEKKGQWQMAANFWGFCHEYCQTIQPDPDALRQQLDDKSYDPHLQKELEAHLAVHQRLATLRQEVNDKAIESARRLFSK